MTRRLRPSPRVLTIHERDLDLVPITHVARWCRYLGMPAGNSTNRLALVLWLADAGHIVPSTTRHRRPRRQP